VIISTPVAQLKIVTDGRFICIEVTNLGAPATFSGIVQPGRGTASAAVARTALWHRATTDECRIETGQSATFRIAQRDRPANPDEVDDRSRPHPEGPQAWRMCYLKKGIGASLERVCPVNRRDGSCEHDGIVLTVMAEPALPGRTAVKTVSLDGERAMDEENGDEFRVLDSPRHYHSSHT
jgi:hypothetical protein